MRAFLRSFFASLLAVIVLLALVVGAVAVKSSHKTKIQDHSYLVIDFHGEILEFHPPTGIMSEIVGGEPETLQRILDNLEMAAVDDRIEGVIMKLSGMNSAGGAMIQEIRDGIKRVQAAGKPVLGFADLLDRKTYYLAVACDSLYMPPSAFFVFTGFGATSTHIKGALEKLGIKPNIHQIREYKSAAEMVTRKDLSKAARENLEWMLEEVWDMLISAILEDRGIDEDQIIEHMQHALFTPEEAKESGLIDGILYWDELEDMLTQEDEERIRSVTQERYAKEDRKKLGLKGEKRIAVIHAQGMIGGRKSKVDPILGIIMGHESVADELKRAREDEDISAIVFRVDSPGGISLESDLIGHAVEITAQEKPVVVSAVDVAASGGYSISYRASKIVADPGSIIGSIGSISGKFNIKKLHDKLGITHDSVTKGPMALFHSAYRDFTDEERERFTKNHWADFNVWLEDIAEHRDMTISEIEELAYGRVWSGRQAVENGLIDELGGLDRAIEIAKELAGIPADDGVTIQHYPKKKGILDMISGEGEGLTAVAQWVIYRFIKQDLSHTWTMLSQKPEYLTETSWHNLF